MKPSPNGRNGRGQFARGNAGGPGNPFAKRTAKLRSALIRAVTPDDVTEIIGKLIEQAKAGDVAAAREVLNRVYGKAATAIDADGLPMGGQALTIHYADDWYGSRAANLAAQGAGQIEDADYIEFVSRRIAADGAT